MDSPPQSMGLGTIGSLGAMKPAGLCRRSPRNTSPVTDLCWPPRVTSLQTNHWSCDRSVAPSLIYVPLSTQPEPCGDCMVWVCCPACANCQESRELKVRTAISTRTLIESTLPAH